MFEVQPQNIKEQIATYEAKGVEIVMAQKQ